MKARCRYCGTESALEFSVGDRNRRITKEVFNYYRCRSCGLIFLDPIPADIGKYYAGPYYTFPTREQIAPFAMHEKYKIDIVQRFVAEGRVLEIGHSWGAFCYLAKQAGFDTEAIEMDTQCCDYINQMLGIRAINDADTCSGLDKATPPDVIALWHVIEHLPDPWAVLDAAANKLRPGGLLVIAAPNPAAFQFRILRRSWVHVDAPRHLELIPECLITDRLRTRGLKRLLYTTADEGSLGWNIFGWEYSLSNLFGSPSLKRFFYKAGTKIGKLLRSIEDREGLGSAYTTVYQKD